MSQSRKSNGRRTAALLIAGLVGMSICCGNAMAFHRPDGEINKIVKAIDALDKAHKELEDAADNFHGHKKAAMEKIEKAKKVLEDSRDGHVGKAEEKLQEATDELEMCVKGDHEGSHPRIHEAMHALKDAKEQL
jgi:chromosome segregation ATPase